MQFALVIHSPTLQRDRARDRTSQACGTRWESPTALGFPAQDQPPKASHLVAQDYARAGQREGNSEGNV